MLLAGAPTILAAAASREDWDSAYCRDAMALPSQSRSWADAICSTGYRPIPQLYRFSDDDPVVVPLYERLSGPPFVKSWQSPPPAWGFGGIVGAAPDVLQLSRVLDDLTVRAPLQVRLRPNPLQHALWDAAAGPRWRRLPRVAHLLNLEGGFERVWEERFRPRTRTTIRKAEKSGLDIAQGNDRTLIADFFALLQKSVDRWAGHQHESKALARWRAGRRDPIAKFHAMADAMGPGLRIYMARLAGRPVAAIIVLQDRNAHYTRGAMDEEPAAATGANYLLHRTAIENACRAGCRTYNMGETGSSAALAQFKSRFGAEPVPYAEYLFERLPVHRLDTAARRVVKRLIGFRDAR